MAASVAVIWRLENAIRNSVEVSDLFSLSSILMGRIKVKGGYVSAGFVYSCTVHSQLQTNASFDVHVFFYFF